MWSHYWSYALSAHGDARRSVRMIFAQSDRSTLNTSIGTQVHPNWNAPSHILSLPTFALCAIWGRPCNIGWPCQAPLRLVPRKSWPRSYSISRDSVCASPVRESLCWFLCFCWHSGYLVNRTGEHRFGLPQPPLPFNGTREARMFGNACPQQEVSFPKEIPVPFPTPSVNISEDCKL